MRTSAVDLEILKTRRRLLASQLKGGALVLYGQVEMVRNRDVRVEFRQESNFYYFTGFEEPDAIMIFRPNMNPEYVLFVRPKDEKQEMWSGFRFGPEGAEKCFGVDKAYPIGEFRAVAKELLKSADPVYYRLNANRDFDDQILGFLEEIKNASGRSGKGFPAIVDPSVIIGELRIKKSEYEIAMIQKAIDISVEAHCQAMRFTRAGVNEHDVYSVLLNGFYAGGAKRQAYPAIVASGNNATTLHYEFNDQICQEGDLLLIDAGAEYNYYAADLTRTFPVSGKFQSAHAELYQKVLQVQKNIIASIQPGRTLEDLQNMAIDGLTEIQLEMGLLTGIKERVIEQGDYRAFYPHNISHWLGSDVHDVGLYKSGDQSRRLEAGMVLTIEPGLYIPSATERAPRALRGVGIRIEDDVLVTESGYRVLSEKLPKEIDQLERV